ncbi:hypothetical protein AVEN_88934-1 [Araneus ventricosus]|uniref:Uncharacterized protein n=1 Tax=Araneus ventricosus TaxID=182803 RepID=A0A4Y2KPZ9_ARAVE|nr:hypothetical protein AVEN_88934-1 [Araneus ventricosus]
MTRTPPELGSPLHISLPHQRGDVWSLGMIWRAADPIRDESSMESGFGPGALWPEAETLPLGHRGPTREHESTALLTT